MRQEILKNLPIVLYLMALLILTSCASTHEYRAAIKKYINQNVDKLYFDNWGAPNEIRQAKSGQILWIYKWSSDHTSESTNHFAPTFQSVRGDNVPTSQHLWCKTVFEINKHDEIVDAKWKGNYCTQFALDLKSGIIK